MLVWFWAQVLVDMTGPLVFCSWTPFSLLVPAFIKRPFSAQRLLALYFYRSSNLFIEPTKMFSLWSSRNQILFLLRCDELEKEPGGYFWYLGQWEQRLSSPGSPHAPTCTILQLFSQSIWAIKQRFERQGSKGHIPYRHLSYTNQPSLKRRVSLSRCGPLRHNSPTRLCLRVVHRPH